MTKSIFKPHVEKERKQTRELFDKYCYKYHNPPTMEEILKRHRAPARRTRDMPEKRVQQKLLREEKEPGIQEEVPSEYGRVDVLKKDEIIEVKHYKHWKHALGQVKAYEKEFKGRKMRIHLFGQGRICLFLKHRIEDACEEEGVTVTWEK